MHITSKTQTPRYPCHSDKGAKRPPEESAASRMRNAASVHLLRLHTVQQKPNLLRRRNRLPNGQGPPPQKRRRRQIHQKISHPPPSLFPILPQHRRRNSPRNRNQEMAPREKSSSDRRNESHLGRPIRRLGRTNPNATNSTRTKQASHDTARAIKNLCHSDQRPKGAAGGIRCTIPHRAPAESRFLPARYAPSSE
jgi:hypothetical protein